jgi:hypothetical protein
MAVGARGPYSVHTLAAGNADDVDALLGEARNEHSAHSARGSPNYGGTAFQRPNANRTTGRETGRRQARRVLELKPSGIGTN